MYPGLSDGGGGASPKFLNIIKFRKGVKKVKDFLPHLEVNWVCRSRWGIFLSLMVRIQ